MRRSFAIDLVASLALASSLAVSANTADADEIAVAADGLTLRAVARAAGVFELTIAPCVDDEGAPAARLVHGPLTLRATADDALRIVCEETGSASPRFVGEVRPLERFGRAAVPGVELRWRAGDDEVIYGLGERFNGLDQAGRRCDMWIADSPGAGADLADSYFCTPVLYSSRGYGIFATDNPEGVFDLNAAGDGWHRYQRGGRALRCYLVFKPNLRELVLARGGLQGPFRGVPDWAWGPWISRNSYEHQRDAVAVIERMAEQRLPVAAIVQEAWKGRSEEGAFNQFSPQRWPDLDAYFALCAKHDIKTILWQVPILHPSSPHFDTGRRQGAFVDKPDGSISYRERWLAGFANLDFTDPNAIALWHDLLRPLFKQGVYGFKADDGEDIKPSDVFADGRRGWQVHNEYSVLYNQSLYDLMDAEGVDGMLWARSGSLGVERTPALWAGDQYPTWAQMRSLVGAGLSAGLSGAPFWGHDIGGYFDTPAPELYIRWLQLGTFSPLMQYHGQTPREPWAFGAEAEQAYRMLAQQRAALQPALIELGRAAAATGMPLMRPMALEFPDDPRFAAEDSQYMLGGDILVAPVFEPNVAGRVVQLPAGEWRHLTKPIAYDGPATRVVPIGLCDAPALLRAGATHMQTPPVLARNLDIPAVGDALAGWAAISYEASEETAARIRCEYAAQVGAEFKTVTATKADGRYEHRFAAGPLGSRSAYRLTLDADAESVELARGEFVWQAPLSLELAASRTLAIIDEPLTVRTTVRSTAQRTVPVKLTLAGGPALQIDPREASFEVAGGGEVAREWTVTPRAGIGPGGARLTARLAAGAGHEQSQTIQLTPPWRWVAVGPFHAEPGRGQLTLYGPEWRASATTAFNHRGAQLVWRQLPPQTAMRDAGVDFGAAFDHQQHAVAFALTRINSPLARDVRVDFGSDDTLSLWLNGELLACEQEFGDAAPAQHAIAGRLRQGVNTLLLKSGQETGAWQAYVRLSDPNGTPLTDLRDGFADFAAFAPGRVAKQTIPSPAPPLAWQLAGPFSPSSDPLSDADLSQEAPWPPPLSQGVWRTYPPRTADGVIDLSQALGPLSNVRGYAAAALHVADPTPAEIVCGSDDGVTVWLNGEVIIDAPEPRAFQHDSHRAPVRLRAGENRLLLRIMQRRGDWLFRLAVWDVSQLPARPLNAR